MEALKMKEGLHILNGDCAADAWKKCGFSGEILVWRENYLMGKLPPLDCPLAEFERIRAAELSRFVPTVPEDRILAALRKADERVLALRGTDSVVLWFDACMYDQMILSRILCLISSLPERPAVFLNCQNLSWDAEAFRLYRDASVELSDADLELGKNAWFRFVSGKTMPEGDFTRLSFLREALDRYAEETPDAAGLGRTQRELLLLVRTGANTPFQVFKGMNAYEKYLFMGDSQCWNMLDELAERGLISITGSDGKPLCLTRAGAPELNAAVILPK